MVSPLGIQEGAAKIAAAEDILNIQLDANSTPTEFGLQFLNKIMVGIESRAVINDNYAADIVRTCKACGKPFELAQNERYCSDCRKLATT